MKQLVEMIRKEIKRKLWEAALMGPGDFVQPDDDSDIWIEQKAESLYMNILESPEAFYEAVTEELFEREDELQLNQYPEYNQEDLQAGKGLERFSELLRNSVYEKQHNSRGLVKIAYDLLQNTTQRMADKAWDNGDAYDDDEY